MGLLGGGGSSASSSSTNNSYVYNWQTIADMAANGNWNINYTPEKLAPMNQYMQNVLNWELNPERFNNAKAFGNNAADLYSKAFGRLQNMANVTPEAISTAFKSGTTDLFNSASGFMEQQNQAIEDQVNAQMGAEFAQNAETMNAGGGTAGSSAMYSSTQSILASGANSMEVQESKVAQNILSAAARATGNEMSAYGRMQKGVTSTAFDAANAFARAAAKSGSSAMHNYWNAALAEQAYEQKESNVARHNAMIVNNEPLMNALNDIILQLQIAGTNTTSNTSGSSSISGGGGLL